MKFDLELDAVKLIIATLVHVDPTGFNPLIRKLLEDIKRQGEAQMTKPQPEQKAP